MNGRTLEVGGGEVGLWSEPEVVRSCLHAEGWDLDSLPRIKDYLFQGLEDRRAVLPDEGWSLLSQRPV